MPKKKTQSKPRKTKSDPDQKERFLAYAKEVGVDESGEEIERMLVQTLRPYGSHNDSGK